MFKKWLRWQEGRRKTGYSKMLLGKIKRGSKFYLDLYLLRFPEGSSAPEHEDVVKGYRHYRCNFIVRQAKQGGEFRSQYFLHNGRMLKIFRSDHAHEVTEVKEGTRYTLSLGIVLKKGV